MPLHPADANNIYEAVSETMNMEAAGEIRALSISIIKPDGNARNLTVLTEGPYRLALMGALTLALRDVQHAVPSKMDPGDPGITEGRRK